MYVPPCFHCIADSWPSTTFSFSSVSYLGWVLSLLSFPPWLMEIISCENIWVDYVQKSWYFVKCTWFFSDTTTSILTAAIMWMIHGYLKIDLRSTRLLIIIIVTLVLRNFRNERSELQSFVNLRQSHYTGSNTRNVITCFARWTCSESVFGVRTTY